MIRKTISVIVPMYYEELVAKECYERLKDVLVKIVEMDYEIVFVNDGSKDKTIDILREIASNDKNVKVIDFARNFGHQVAVTAGLFNCKGDAVVIIDADLQDPPELILEMIDKWKQGYDVVYGKRKKRNGESKFKLITAKYFYRFLATMSDVEIPKDTGDFRLIDRRVVEAFKEMPERNRFIRGMISWIGFNQTYIEYNRDERFAGETKYPLKKMLKFASDGIIAFSSKPLKLMSFLGGTTIFLSIILMVYALISKLFYKTDSGWTSLMFVILFFSGVQLLSLGVIGEYIARIYDESKNRPLYLIKDKINFEERD
ncbi:MAG: glycosyltransferase family 2 protein [Clostridium perfringens]|uniref:glycosyltransferase family 2 protein n=1 Tax=Clostridium perfringens TaxID=1502 RepID=UPI00290A818D|nr:glycosyltransferase family 2 protein [Clostridium perfringens]MDK0980187.1 glycosyltransferase family 2 protein [Clostridium perfringens]MDM0492775.1 glycosyltransferase family 2 protein [Clostridium perfringens]MDU7884963.1 glycosyltransferase family 2 protein [Clostridium perfringens]MDU7956432.1 glycosyltransferase family 2 protein [Clostridium perfringens]